MTETARPVRFRSVDVLRGATVVGMILVNNPGDWGHVYAPLLHAEWHGWTPTDLVFPFFLFVVGVSIVLALGAKVGAIAERRAVVAKVTRRSITLFALGLFLSGYPFGLFGPRSFERLLETWRIPGVLQRIAVCYFVVALLYLFVRRRTLVATCTTLLVGYWLALTRIPVPGIGAPDLATKGDHLAGWLDRTVLGNHLWSLGKVYDPEGISSTLPAIATTLLGVFAGTVLTRVEGTSERVARLFVLGAPWVVAGFVWSWFFPINKSLWTSSYALFTAGLAACALALAVWLFDRGDRWRGVARPFETYGTQAITVFVGSGVLAKTLLYVKPGGTSLHAHLYGVLFASWLPPHLASLAFALAWVVGWYVILRTLAARGWAWRV